MPHTLMPHTHMAQEQHFTLPTMLLAGTMLLSGVAGDAKRLALDESYYVAGLLLVAATILVTVMVAWNYVTDLRRKADRLAREKLDLQRQLTEFQTAREGDRRFATMSHELRTPLNGVIGMLGLLKETELTAEQNNYATIAHTSGRNLLSLIDELLDRARAEAVHDETSEGAELGAIMENVTELLAPRAHGKGIAISSYVAPSVPLRLPFRDLHLRQLLFNLAGNSIKFTDRGSVAIDADVTGQGALTIRIADTGIGMSPDELSRVFKPFTQANDQTRNQFGGTGLGLAISRKLVSDMQGTLTVESQSGIGTEFVITLPLSTSAPGESQEHPTPLVGRSYALVMAESVPCNHLAKNLGDAGATTHAWPHAGKDLAQALIKNENLTGIICDCASAKTVLRHLRKLQKAKKPLPQLWILMKPEERRLHQNLLKSPATGYLVQPLRRATLVSQLTSRDTESLTRASRNLRKLVTSGPKQKARKQNALRILLVDDTPVNAMVATAMLGKAGHDIVVATDGRKALAVLARDRRFDLVLLDLEMPEMDGFATARTIRRDEADQKLAAMPILALTANARAEDATRCFAAGMNGHLTKPFERHDIEEALHKLTRRKAA
jgi:signal transduction histidine kinase/CheY-like chemotaxis protein